jgi:general secretion pathway protein E
MNVWPLIFAKQNHVLLKDQTEEKVHVIYRAGLQFSTLSELLRCVSKSLFLERVSAEEFDILLMRLYEKNSDEAMQSVERIYDNLDGGLETALPKAVDLLDGHDEAPIIRLINVIFAEAVKRRASDIHIETYEDTMAVRYRIDGVLQEVLKPQRSIALLVISRIKVMSKMDIAEKRLPQDGRISILLGERQVDVRVSSMPTQYGERIVMRLLDKHAMKLDIDGLGLSDQQLALLHHALERPHGMIIVTGPTGSGKTTTLYAGLSTLDVATKNVLTVEDPIEYELAGISQTQVNAKIEMTFARALRAILRQDPDVVMLGEIRDAETAEIAVQASQTGHLVLSTLHTNNAIGAISRLKNLNIDAQLLGDSILALVGQRLVRRLCEKCKQKRTLTEKEKRVFENIPGYTEDIQIFDAHSKGCKACVSAGFMGRMGVYEVIAMDETLLAMICKEAPEYEMAEWVSKTAGSMRKSGLIAVLQGITTLAEVDRITMEH